MDGAPALQPWWSVSWFRWVGVQVFFVLSGFVIAFSSEGASVARFVRSQVLRLAPALWIRIPVCAVALVAWGSPIANVVWLAAKTAVLAPKGPWIAGQIWTLGIEVFFYAAIAFLLLADSFRRVQLLDWVLAGVSALYWLLIASGTVADTAGRITQLLLLQHGCYFALGLAIWLISRLGATTGRLLFCALCVATACFQIDATLVAERPGYGLGDQPLVPFLWWLAMVLLMAASVRFNPAIVRLAPKAGPTIRLLGIMTYPLYLLHYYVGGSAMIAADELGAPPVMALLAAIVSSLAAAYLSAQWFEPRVYGMLRACLTALGRWSGALPPSLRHSTARLAA